MRSSSAEYRRQRAIRGRWRRAHQPRPVPLDGQTARDGVRRERPEPGAPCVLHKAARRHVALRVI